MPVRNTLNSTWQDFLGRETAKCTKGTVKAAGEELAAGEDLLEARRF
jgi:hypothetical protein